MSALSVLTGTLFANRRSRVPDAYTLPLNRIPVEMHRVIRTLLLAFAAALAGCALGYDLAQDRAAAACKQIPLGDERLACEKRSQVSYEQYEKDRQKANPGSVPPADPPKENSLCFRRAATGELVCPN